METAPTLDSPNETPTREWTSPQIECYETRPEVTAYSGGGDPWTNR